VNTRGNALSIVQVNCAFDKMLVDPDELLDRYSTLTGWSDALAAAGAGRVGVVQRFYRRARIARNGVDYVFCDGSAVAVSRAVADMRPDIAHVNGLTFPAQTWTLRRVLPPSAAIVVQNHSDGGPIGRAPRLRLAGRAARRAADAFLFAADEHAAAWRQAGVIAPDQPTYRVMEASTTLRRPAGLARTSARDAAALRGSPAILWVGRLNANKDPLTVLDGFERSLARLPDAVLTMIYATGELLPAVRERVARSGALYERVVLVGAVPHERMPLYFSAADLFVVGSHHEGSGYSLMEACACGAVPVVTDIPTFRLLTGDVAGAVWTPGDAAACARALIDVAGRDLAAERVRLAAYVTDVLSWDAIGRRALEIYAEVVERRRATSPSA
jgi:glycosyltransferase involved in cell wall biosynthesis